MSQNRSEQISESTPVARNDSSLIQEKLSAQQANHFRVLPTPYPENKGAEGELASLEEERCDSSHSEEAEEDMNSYSDYEVPTLEDDPKLGESLDDYDHTGNGIPCKFYNRTECKNGRACRFSHAPDEKSERDALGRNVCRYYLFGVCKFGERCSYLHSKEYLSQQGWWSTAEGIDQERGHYNKTSKKRQPKKNRDIRARPGLWGSDAGVTGAKNFSLRAPSASTIGQSSQGAGMKNKRNPTFYSYSSSGEYDSDGDDDMAMCGFTGSQVAELVCHGVKPWDDDAWDVLDALREF